MGGWPAMCRGRQADGGGRVEPVRIESVGGFGGEAELYLLYSRWRVRKRRVSIASGHPKLGGGAAAMLRSIRSRRCSWAWAWAVAVHGSAWQWQWPSAAATYFVSASAECLIVCRTVGIGGLTLSCVGLAHSTRSVSSR